MLLDTFATDSRSFQVPQAYAAIPSVCLTSSPVRVLGDDPLASRLCMGCQNPLGDCVAVVIMIAYPPEATGDPAMPSAIAMWSHFRCDRPDPAVLAGQALFAWSRQENYRIARVFSANLEMHAETGDPLPAGRKRYHVKEV